MGLFKKESSSSSSCSSYEGTGYIFATFGTAVVHLQKVNRNLTFPGAVIRLVEEKIGVSDYYVKVTINNNHVRSTYLTDEPENGRVFLRVVYEINKGNAKSWCDKYIANILRLCPKEGRPIVQPAKQSVADQLLDYKKLLDAGIITKEEFEEKKRTLLGDK